MKVKQEILDKINNVSSRKKLLEEMSTDIGDQALYKQIKDNVDDGPLTKMKALQAISTVTGIPIPEILEETAVNHAQN